MRVLSNLKCVRLFRNMSLVRVLQPAVGAVVMLLMMSAVSSANAATLQCAEGVVDDLEKVGDTRLRVYFFSVYDAALYTPDGNYPANEKALVISYLRSIKSEQLVNTTRDEWEKLGYGIGDREQQWLTYLDDIWPDVQEGDCLLARTTVSGETRFYNRNGQLGEVAEPEFADRFFDIWLSENSSFRRNRDELTGARP